MATEYQPPSYNEATRQHASVGGDFTFVDFIPGVTETGFFSTEHERFSVLIDRANAWLVSQPTLEVKTCESVEFKARDGIPNTNKMSYFEHEKYSIRYIRGLRLWLVPRTDPSRPCQKLGYLNLVPNAKDSQSIFSYSNYETLNELLERFNKTAAATLPGRILAIESQEMKVPMSSNFDPDRSSWQESGQSTTRFLFVIRIFFEFGGNAEEIGVADFVPVMLEEGGMFALPRFEPFSYVISRASQWCEQQQSLRFCNAQSLEIKIKSDFSIDTQRMGFTEHGQRRTRYVRVLRVTYTKAAQHDMLSTAPVLRLTCKTFIPYQLTTGTSRPEFESLRETKHRMITWMQLTGARVLSAETVAIRLLLGGLAMNGVEDSFTFNPSSENEYWIYIFRIYLDGHYPEPPPGSLPSPPPIEDVCCNVI